MQERPVNILDAIFGCWHFWAIAQGHFMKNIADHISPKENIL